MDLNEFVVWVNQGKRRSLKVELDSSGKSNIIVGEYDEGYHYECQMVNSVQEIDLAAIREQREQADYARLKAKFEPAAIPPALVENALRSI